jgi:hypothetical protein
LPSNGSPRKILFEGWSFAMKRMSLVQDGRDMS